VERSCIISERLEYERLSLPQRSDRHASDHVINARDCSGRQRVRGYGSHLDILLSQGTDHRDILRGDDHVHALRADVVQACRDAAGDQREDKKRSAGDQSTSAGDRSVTEISASSRSVGETSGKISNRSDQLTPEAGIRIHCAARGCLLPVLAEM